jgi:hypothetical protein
MSKMKDRVIRDEDHFDEMMLKPNLAQAVKQRAARVSAGGGDAMSLMVVLASLEKEAATKGLTLDQLADEAAQEEVSGVMAQADPADKELDRAQAAASTLPAPAEESAQEPPDQAQPTAVQFAMPPQQYMKKGQRFTLVFQGVCTHCAHCGMALTDSVSIERGLGPVCSSRGYLEDPKDPDEMQAMIDLAEYPDLVDFLVKNYKPKGVRGLMNGLVKICSLNRRSPVHQACCDAIESLGYKTLASTLRESIAVIEIKSHDDKTFHLWVKKAEWHMAWQYDLRQIPGAYMSRQHKGWLVPKNQKHVLWALMLRHYEGLCAKVPGDDGSGKKTVKITEKIVPPASQPQVNAAT